MAATDGSIYSFAEEQSPKSLGDDTAMTIMPFQSVDFDISRGFSPSGEARDDYYETEEDYVSKDGRLTLNRKFRPRVYDPFFESALFSTFTRNINRENPYGAAAQQITNVDALTSTISVTDEGTAFAETQLVYASGFTNPQNNGLHVAQTLSGSTALIVAGTLVDETPPRGAKLEVVGVKGAAGDFATQAGPNAIASTATVDFSAFGCFAGCWVKIGSVETANKFDTILVNDAVRASSDGSDGTILLDRVPSGWVADAGAGKEIYLFFSEPLLPGTTAKTFTSQIAIRRPSDFKIFRMSGGYVEEITVNGEAQSDFTVSIGKRFLDFDDEDPADLNARANGPRREAVLPKAMVAGLAGQRIYLDGVYSTTNAAVRSSSLVISPTLVPIDIEGCFSFAAMSRSTQMFDLTGECHFQTDAFADPYTNSQNLDFARVMHSGKSGYVMEIPRLQFTELNPSLPGKGQAITFNFTSKATADDAGIQAGNFNNFGAIFRFIYADGWPNLC